MSPDGLARASAVTGALLAFLSVAAGAFGAHALRSRVAPELLTVFETGARYQMYHALGLLALAALVLRWPHPLQVWVFVLMIVGVVLFSGSLYALTLSGVRWFGAITPIGGSAWLLAWALLAWSVWRSPGA